MSGVTLTAPRAPTMSGTPGSPPSGYVALFRDSTTGRLNQKDSSGATSGVIPQASISDAQTGTDDLKYVTSALLRWLTSVRQINAQTGTTYTFTADDWGKIVSTSHTSAQTITIPTNASVPYPIGTVITVLRLNTGIPNIVGDGGVTVHGDPGTKIAARYTAADCLKIDTNEWVVLGRLMA